LEEEEEILPTLFAARLELESKFLALCMLILSPQFLMKYINVWNLPPITPSRALEPIISGKEDVANNYARGHYTVKESC
jgi:hypothetical protein